MLPVAVVGAYIGTAPAKNAARPALRRIPVQLSFSGNGFPLRHQFHVLLRLVTHLQ